MLEYDINELLNQAGFGFWTVKCVIVWIYSVCVTLATYFFISHRFEIFEQQLCSKDFNENNNTTIDYEARTPKGNCKEEHVNETFYWVYPVGFCTLAIISSIIVDIIGRKQTLIILTVLQIMLTLNLHFMSSLLSVNVIYFAEIILKEVKFSGIAILLCELSTNSKRARFMYANYSLIFVGKHIVNYADFIIFSHANFAIVLILAQIVELCLLYRILDNSPRWLLQKHRFKEAAELITKVFNENKSTMQVAVKEVIKEISTLKLDEASKTCWNKYNLCQLFSTKQGAINMITLSINWYSTEMHLLLYAEPMERKSTLLLVVAYLFITAIVYASQYFTANKFGRKIAFQLAAIFAFLLSVLLQISVYLIGDNNLFYSLAAFTYICINTSAETGLFLLSVEFLPTCFRATGTTFALVCGWPFSVINNFLMTHFNGKLIFCTVVAPSLFLCLISSKFLPETLHKDIPDDIEEYHLSTKTLTVSTNKKNVCESALMASFI